jgi:hypothetical protein
MRRSRWRQGIPRPIIRTWRMHHLVLFAIFPHPEMQHAVLLQKYNSNGNGFPTNLSQNVIDRPIVSSINWSRIGKHIDGLRCNRYSRLVGGSRHH